MALISIRNVVEPFQNKTHLFTIVVIAVIFGVWRASGGSFSSRTVSSPTPISESSLLMQQRSAGSVGTQKVQQRPPQHHGAPKGSSSNTSHDLDSLLGTQAPQKQPDQNQPHHSALDDIEKSLGMR